ncbi:MAG TPA: hypothetical protein ENN28_01970 [Candidatus Uhrbacteria bacterium]|nr:hypothetical protein [Candidatus Uhrbacteria bacterium]
MKKTEYKIWMIVLILVIFLLPQNSLASNLHTLSDKMSRHAPSIGSDHEIRFTTPSGIGEAGQYLRIIFDSGFDLSNITYADINLFHGPATGFETEEVLSSTPTATNWGVNISGNLIDFIHPIDDANGDISPNDKVVIRIGLNASGGSKQIINPATAGSKIISFSGNYGDSGKLAVAIFEDQISVDSKTEGIPPNPVVLYPPSNITANSMFLSWSQNTDFDFDRYELYFSETSEVTNFNGYLVCSNFLYSETSCVVSSLLSNKEYFFVLYVYNTENLSSASNEVSARTIKPGGGIVLPTQPGTPTVDERICPIFSANFLIEGNRQQDTIIFINGSTDNISYPSATRWNSYISLSLGNNPFYIWARDNYGQISNILNIMVARCKIGDTNCDGKVDDFDLAGLAYNWQTDWCYADFNDDGIVDDFDLSGLAAYWDGIY